MKIPVKVSPSSIVEAVTEIRFDSDMPSAVLFGKLYAGLSKDFNTTEQLPILQMPEEFRRTQPELEYAPHYRLKNDRFIVNIGQRIISVNRICTKFEYDSWAEYFPVIKKVFAEVAKTKMVTKANKVSVRYINFEQKGVPDVLNLELNLFGSKINDYSSLALSFVRKVDENTRLRVILNSDAKIKDEGETREGLIINMEAYQDTDISMADVSSVTDALHSVAKESYFTALNKDFLKTLNPQYE